MTASGIIKHQVEVGPLIGSGVLNINLPRVAARHESGGEASATSLGSLSPYIELAHPNTGNLIEGWKWDQRTWSDKTNDNNASTIPANWDPTTSGITEAYFQSGIGSNRDLELEGIHVVPSSGINEEGIVNVWAPEVRHGWYYDFSEDSYLFSDDSEILYTTYNSVVPGLNLTTASGFTELTLNASLKVGVPITAEQWKWDSLEGKYEIFRELRRKINFTGQRDDDNVRASTYNSSKEEILFENVDRDFDEFVVSTSGVVPKIIFSNNYGEEIGSGTAPSGLEIVGISNGNANQQFHTEYAPLDSLLDTKVYSYITTSGTLTEWETVDGNATLSGNQVHLDTDLGILEFGDPTVTGVNAPSAGSTIGVNYWTSVKVEFEPEFSSDTVLATEASINPIYRRNSRGFVYLSTQLEDPTSIELSADLTEIQSNIFGPIFIGNSYAPVVATVKDRRGQLLESQSVRFFITSNPVAGTFGNLGENIISPTDEFGQARAFYNPPRGINEIAESITASGFSIDNSPTLPGLTQTTTFHTENLLIEGDTDDVFLYQVFTDDYLQGGFNHDVGTTSAEQVEEYYRQYFIDNDIYGRLGVNPTDSGLYSFAGVPSVDGAITDSAIWEYYHRLQWDLSRPSIFSSSAGQGRRVLVAALDSGMLNPHTLLPGAVGPVQPVLIESPTDGEYDVIFDTSATTIPEPTGTGPVPSGTLHSYLLVAPTTVSIQASVFNERLNQNILSNEISIKLNIPPYLSGLWILDSINETEIDEISSVLSTVTASGQKIPLGFRLRSSNVTLAAALDGVTFLDVNEVVTSGTLGHQVSVDIPDLFPV